MNFLDHYWYVGGDTTQVYSSRLGDYIALDDDNYMAWVTSPSNNATGVWGDTEYALGEYLGKNVSPKPVPADILDGWKQGQTEFLDCADGLPQTLLWITNEVRALQSQPALTLPEFRDLIKGIL